MGKGKRNRQTHLEDKLVNPDKYREQKKSRTMPKWATRTIWIAVLVLIVAAIVLVAMAQNGVFLRAQVLVKSSEGYDLNRQMASFIVWQSLYQQGYQEWYYAYYGLSNDENKITETYSNPSEYAILYASNSTTTYLRDVIESSGDYLVELVAGADAAAAKGLELNEYDRAAIDEIVTWIKDLQKNAVPEASLNSFLNVYVGEGVTETDVKAAAKLMAMYTKYCDYTKYEMNSDSSIGENELLTFIAKNPVDHYNAVYRAFEAADADEAKKFEEIESEAEFTDLVADILLEKHLNDLLLTKFALPDANEAGDKLNTAKKDKDADKAFPAALEELGLKFETYTQSTEDGKKVYDPEIKDSVLTEWLFDSSRKAKDFKVITGEDAVYLACVLTDPSVDSDETSVNAAWKTYALKDYEEETKDYAPLIKRDLISAERKDTTDNKSSEEFAEELISALKKDEVAVKDIDKKDYPTVTEIKKGISTKKPEENSSSSTTTVQDAPDAILDELYKSGAAIQKNTFYQADDDAGNSYVIEVTDINGTNYKIDYAVVEDSTYYSVFRSMKSKMDAAYPLVAPTLKYPDLSEDKDTDALSFEEWMCESTLTEADNDTPATLTFARKKNDVKWFESETTTETTGGTSLTKKVYKAYIVVTPMEIETQSDTQTAHGGYLKYNSEEEAIAAYETICELEGFELWHAFKSLKVVTEAKVEGETDTTTNATINTKIEKTTSGIDEKVRDWFFTKDLKESVDVVEGKDGSFYLTYFKSASDTAWERDTKDEYITATLTEELEALIAEGEYKLDEAVLEKLGELQLESETE